MSARKGVFYGWWVLAALFVVGALGPMARYSMSAFFPAVSSELGWSRSVIGTAQSVSLWAYSIVSILSGWMIDRLGSRMTILLGGLFCLAGWLLLSTMNSLWQLYVYYGLIMAIAVSYTHLVPIQSTSRKWFVKRAGLAGGIVGSAFALGTAALSPLLTSMAVEFGWRTVSIVAAFVSGTPVMLLACFVIRDTPESVGQQPDGAARPPQSEDNGPSGTIPWIVKDALRTPQFWLLFVGYSFLGIVFNGLMAHLVIWAVDVGSSVAAAGVFVTLFNGPSIIARVGGGMLGDRYGKRRIIVLGSSLTMVIALIGGLAVDAPAPLAYFAVAIGLAMGLSNTLFAPYLGDLFGRKNLGSLFGILTLGWGLIGGLGPMLWGTIFDVTGSYSPAVLMSVGCYAVAVVALLLIRPLRTGVAHESGRTRGDYA